MLISSCFENNWYYFFWKPFTVPSTFGKQKSFLDYMLSKEISLETKFNWPFVEYLKNLKPIENINKIIDNQIKFFWKDKELWLLNRLDNDTSWLLYFASTPQDMDKYRQSQLQWRITKFYIAQVHWKLGKNESEFQIDYPIMHHKSKADRMIIIKTAKDFLKWRWRQHNVSTTVKNLNYNSHTNISTLLLSINKGIRHQIRLHLASIGHPIIWDVLYGENKKSESKLQLYSLWFEISK